MSDPENRPQYCICNKHTWLTAISKRATFECPACRADELQAQLDAVKPWLKHDYGCSAPASVCICGLAQASEQEQS